MKIIFAIGGNNVLDIYTAIENAEFDKLYILCEPKQESLQRLAEDIGGELLTEGEARYAADLVQYLEEPWLEGWFASLDTAKKN